MPGMTSDERPRGLDDGDRNPGDDTLLRSGPEDAVDDQGRRDDVVRDNPNPLAAGQGFAVQPPAELMGDSADRWGGSDDAYAKAYARGETPNQGADGGVYRADGGGDYERRGDLGDRDAGRVEADELSDQGARGSNR